ncbi:hypothetical protein [Pyrobaculum neutrophilum]|uniref:Uncharacterized protein n=1 Tax=Pyrobaculum neutrophilum (strain DSM 2338 / JCM 9278 / NBRC 100436 / V24Sta) TaxID=444157 RepID=B1YCS6_PYRNV|nr:hypothetical protein [Pyrobaculum neutrophilum]ACB39589.1 conserved hypothetical protein [Pyrobaculum neutrophilum V24Sta]
MEYIALTRGPARGLYYIAAGAPRCGQIRVRLAELPTDAEPPFKARPMKYGVVVEKTDLESYLLQHIDQLIEGEIRGGVLDGVVCNRRVAIRVLDPTISGPVLAAIPVTRIGRFPPKAALTLLAYKLQLV